MAVPALALALILAGPAVPAAAAAAAAGPWINPANGAFLTSDTVTVYAQGSNYGAFLTVDGVRRAFGDRLSYTIDGHRVANGRHHATVIIRTGGYGPWGGPSGYARTDSSFNMVVPAYPPAGVSVSVSGTTVKVGWDRGPEPDLTGYTVRSRYGTASVPASCSNGRCGTSFRVPAGASGDLPVSVVANRALSGASRASSGSVRLVAALAPPKPKPRKSPTPDVTVQEASPDETKPDEQTVQPSDAAASEPSVEPPLWSPAPGTEVTSVASLQSEGESTSSRLMMAWMFVFIFVLGLLGAHFGTAARRRRRRQEALLSSGPKSRHRRQMALRAGPEIILKWNETVRLNPPGGRANDSLNSPGHAPDSDADVPPRWS